MAKYILNYWFEHGGICLWSANDNSRSKYDYPIDNDKLPILKELIDELYALEGEYQGYLNWSYPPDPSPWTAEQKKGFISRANMAYLELVSELGNDFEVIINCKNGR